MKSILILLGLFSILPFSAAAFVAKPSLSFSCSLFQSKAELPSSARFDLADGLRGGFINGAPLRLVKKNSGNFLTDGTHYYWVWDLEAHPTIVVYRALGAPFAYYNCSRI